MEKRKQYSHAKTMHGNPAVFNGFGTVRPSINVTSRLDSRHRGNGCNKHAFLSSSCPQSLSSCRRGAGIQVMRIN